MLPDLRVPNSGLPPTARAMDLFLQTSNAGTAGPVGFSTGLEVASNGFDTSSSCTEAAR